MRASVASFRATLLGLLLIAPSPAEAAGGNSGPALSATRVARARPNSLLRTLGALPATVRWQVQRGVAKLHGVAGDKRPVLVGPKGDPIAPEWQAKGKVVFGVMGRAGAEQLAPAQIRCQEIVGETIAALGDITLNGGCPGRPENTARGARSKGGIVVAVSPWSSWKAHKRSGAPTDYTALKLTKLPPVLASRTGEANYMGREIDNVIHSDAVVVLGGGWGTLGELAIAVEYQRPVGVLLNNGPGVANSVANIEREISRAGKPPRAPILYDDNPERLVRSLRQAVLEQRAAGAKRGPLGDAR